MKHNELKQQLSRCSDNMIKITKGITQIGDVILAETNLSCQQYKITRVSKTLAFSKRKSDGYEYTFKRKISLSMIHPYRQWSTTKYTVFRKTDPEA